MIIALAGYSGFIGNSIQRNYSEHQFILLGREELYGDVSNLKEKIKNADILMNFAGYPISRRWTSRRRELIRDSRIVVTRKLVSACNQLKEPPKLFINASAIGIYENDKEHSEQKYTYGNGFMADIVKDWESEAKDLDGTIKLALIRLGMVLGQNGGAFPLLKRLFSLGMGGKIGSGKQVYSFIHIRDVLNALDFIIKNELSGTYNFTAPHPVSNREFTRILASSLHRPAFIPVPTIALKLFLGEASEIVTRGQTVYPEKLLIEGYKFTFATLESALDNLIKKK